MKLQKLQRRLLRIGVRIGLQGNHPWIYMRTVNDNVVSEQFHSSYGYTIAMISSGEGPTDVDFVDTAHLFKTIRRYACIRK